MSQRRALLIDSDLAFLRLLDEHLRPHGIAIDRDPDADALTRAAAAPPALLIIAVDEPDKIGYSLCNKAKKGPLAHVPVMLATSTIPPEGFANHRKLKLHADEYVDKRTDGAAVLGAKLDALLGLQAADAEREMVLVEDDAVEIADSELILEESAVDERPTQEAGGSAPAGITDALLLDAETDAAFAFLTGDEDASMTTNTGTPALPPADSDALDVSLADRFDTPPAEPAPKEDAAPLPVDAADEATAARRGPPTLPPPLPPLPTMLPAEVPESEAALAETADLDLDAVTMVPPPAPPLSEVRLDAALTAAQRSIGDALPERARIGAAPPTAVTAGPNEATSPAAPAYAMEHLPTGAKGAAEVAPLHGEAQASRRRSSPRIADAGGDDPPKRPRTNLDLGLDEIAERADREQSGLIDRRAMHRAADLERENQQLRAELARVRASGSDAAKTPIEREFFALREAMVTKERELATLRDTMASKDRELTLERDRLRQLQHTKATLETKNHELEARLLAESERGSASDATQRAAAAQVAALRHEIDARTQAVAAAESARAAAERELAAERVARMAMAAKVEDSIGAERASIEEYYRTELAAARANAAGEREAAVSAALTEVEAEHDRALGAVRAAHRAELEQRDQATAEAIARARQEERAAVEAGLHESDAERAAALERRAAEHAAALADSEERAKAEIAALRRQHTAELERVAAAHETALSVARGEREHLAVAMTEGKSHHAAELEALRTEHAKELRSIEEHQARVTEVLRQELAAAKEELAAAREQAQHALAEGQRAAQELRAQAAASVAKLRADTDLALTKARIDGEAAAAKVKVDGENALAKQKSEADAALAKLRGEHAAALTKVRSEGEAAQAKLRAELDATRAEGTAEQQRAIAVAIEERDELRAGLTSAREQIRQLEAKQGQLQEQLAELDATMATGIARLEESKRRIDELRDEIKTLEGENAAYQEQVLKAYQKIKQDEAMVTRAKKALAIAFSVLDDEKPNP